MKLKSLSIAMMLTSLPMTGALAAAMDRSAQSVSAFLQPGNYAEAGLFVLDPNVSGTSSDSPLLGPARNQSSGDMAGSYHSANAAIKVQATDKISIGLLFDQPFGADAEYKAPNAGLNAFSANNEGTSATVSSENLTLLFGYQPSTNWNFYAGPVWQQVKGDVHLRGTAYSLLGGTPVPVSPSVAIPGQAYDAKIQRKEAWGWAAGLAYQIPEIALKASLTYRSAIKHQHDAIETFGGNSTASLGQPIPIRTDTTEVKTPQSVNLDFQTGVMENTIAFATVRWVNWDGFAIRPNAFGQVLDAMANSGDPRFSKLKGGNLVEYNKDQWTINAGVGRKFNEKWSANMSVGWDSGAGDPITTLGPTKGYWSLGLGGQYSPAENYFVQAGIKYFWLGDAQALTVANDNVGQFNNNHALGYGLKFGYRF